MCIYYQNRNSYQLHCSFITRNNCCYQIDNDDDFDFNFDVNLLSRLTVEKQTPFFKIHDFRTYVNFSA